MENLHTQINILIHEFKSADYLQRYVFVERIHVEEYTN
jgi:hypothetical protein